MTRTDAGAAEEQFLLYELSLSIGQTLDPHITCRAFLNVLASRQHLDSASIWWRDPSATNELFLLESIPDDSIRTDRLPLSHPFWQHTCNGKIRFFTAKDDEFASLAVESDKHCGAYALFPLNEQGVLVLRLVSSVTFSPNMLGQFRGVAHRLAIAIQGGMAHARLQQSETETHQATLLLAEEKRRSQHFDAQIENAHSQLQSLIHSLPDLVWLKDPEGRYLACNNRFGHFFGAREIDIVGKTDYDFVDEELANFFRQQDQLAIANGRSTANEEWISFADDGHSELLETIKTPMFGASGQLIGVLGIGHDITERKQAEETLRTTEERSRHLASMLRLMCDNVPDMIWAKGLDKRYLFANKAICEQLLNAANIKEPLGRTDMFFAQRERDKHQDNPDWHTFGELCQDSDAITLERGEPLVFEEYGNVKGRFVCLEVHKSPFFDANGEVIGTVGSARDITDRKKIEAELELHRQHLEELVEQRTTALLETEAKASHILQSSADGLYGVDAEGRITFVNPAACTMLGYRSEEAIGRNAHQLFHHSRPGGSPYLNEECPAREALLTGREIRIDNEVYWHSDGHAVPVMYAVHPTHKNGEISGAVVSFVDISEQRAAAEARERALTAAEHLARVKSEFLANMSHEIRTPLNGVLGFAQIGSRNFRDAEKTLNAFRKIITSGNQLLGVVNDVLDFSKIEAGKLRIAQTETLLHEAIDNALDLVRDRAVAKGLELRLEKAPDLPTSCISDPLRVGQVLLNLLSNAVKFTDVGTVTLTTCRVGEKLVFRVTDTGIGMDAEQLDDIFAPFLQADGSSTRRFGGTGLGFTISKRILELMGGDIRVESQSGIGSFFEFCLPYIKPEKLLKTQAGIDQGDSVRLGKPLSGLSILVAEDDPINQMVLEHNLLEEGASIVVVGNGQDAVERVLSDGAAAYDLVLMDVQMPEMDGYEAARRIREFAPDLPIVGQTAHVLGDEQERCIASGMVRYIPKPIDPDALLKILLQVVSPRHNR